jgi:hypothetical protein
VEVIQENAYVFLVVLVAQNSTYSLSGEESPFSEAMMMSFVYCKKESSRNHWKKSLYE